MARSPRRAAVLLVVLAAGLIGCAAEQNSPQSGRSSTPSPSAASSSAGPAYPPFDCLPADSPLARVGKTPGGHIVGMIAVGSGPRGVVLGPESGADACQWLPQAQRLAEMGYRVVAFDWGTAPRDELLAYAVEELKRDGATRIALGGASRGGMVSLLYAADIEPRPVGVFALGAPNTTRLFGPVAPGLRRYRGPVLMVSAVDDGIVPVRELRLLARAHRGRERVVVLPGSEHGYDLLTGPHAERVTGLIDRFLRKAFG